MNNAFACPASTTSVETSTPELPGIYVASRASIPARSAMWRALRDDSGWPIISSWIDEAGEGETDCLADLWVRIHSEIGRSAGVLLFVAPEDFPLKGALIECGIAMGLGLPVAIVAPDVELEPQSMRPLGSWANHPTVTMHASLSDARDRLLREAAGTRAASAWLRNLDWQHFDDGATADALRSVGVNTPTLANVTAIQRHMAHAYKELLPVPTARTGCPVGFAVVPVASGVHPAFGAMEMAAAQVLSDPEVCGLTQEQVATVDLTGLVREIVSAAGRHRRSWPERWTFLGTPSPETTAARQAIDAETAETLARAHGVYFGSSEQLTNFVEAVTGGVRTVSPAVSDRGGEPASTRISESGQQPGALVDALKFYAQGHHFTVHKPDMWDTVSGEPGNFQEDEANSATVEDGSVAKMALDSLSIARAIALQGAEPAAVGRVAFRTSRREPAVDWFPDVDIRHGTLLYQAPERE